MKALVAHKLGMTQIFGDKGKLIPVTLVKAEDCFVAGARSLDKDGYEATIIGYGENKKPGKSAKNQFKDLKMTPKFVREVRLLDEKEQETIGAEESNQGDSKSSNITFNPGEKLDVSMFEPGEEVTISGTSKGKGFAGTIKRHNFHRGPKTHGSKSYRDPGSIGSMYPQKIFKGKKMAGRMGQDKVTIKKVKIAEIDATENILALVGAVPGSRNSIVVITGAK